MQWIKKFIFQLSEVYIRQTQGQIILPETLIFILRIQSYLLSLSYVSEKQEISYLYTIAIVARPQIFLPNTEIFSYIIFVLSTLSVFQGIGVFKSKFILIFTTLMKSGIINFVFEICIGQIQLITQIMIIFITFIQLLISEGTFNINLINFDKVQVKTLDYMLAILNYLQMFFYKYSQSQIYLEICTLMIMVLQVLNLSLNHSSLYNYQKSLFLTILIFSIYIWLKFFFSYRLNDVSELISIPFIYQIIYSYLQNNYKIKQFVQSKNKKGYNINFIIEHFKDLKSIERLQIKIPKSNEKQICFASILILQNKYYDAFYLLKSLKNNKKYITRIKINLLIEYCLKKLANISNIELKGINQISQISDSIIQSENSNIQILQQIKDLIQLKLDCLNLFLSHKTNRNYCQLLVFVKKFINLKQLLEYKYECYPSQKTQNILGFLYSEIINDYFSAHELKSVSAISDEKMRRITLNQDIFSNKMIYLLANFDGKLKINSISNDSGGILDCTIQDLFQQNVDILVPPGVQECHDLLILNFFETGASKYIRQINPNFLYNIKQNYFSDIEFTTDMCFTQDLKFIIFIQPQNIQSMALILDNNRKIKCLSKALIDEVRLKDHNHLIGKNINKILPSFPVNIQKDNFVENALAYFQNIEEQLLNSSIQNQFNTQYSIQQRKINDQEKYIIVGFYYFKSNMQSLIGSQQSSQSCQQELLQNFVQENGLRHFIGVESQVKIPIDEINQGINRGLFEVNVYGIDGIYSENSNYLNEQKIETTNIQVLNKQTEELLQGQKYFSNTNLIPSKLSNLVISKQENSNKQQQDNFAFHDEQSSYVSSMQGFKKSMFYKKYLVVQKIQLQKSFLKDQKLFILFLILCLIFQIVLQLLQLIQISQNLDKLVSDVDLLEIKNLMYQPFESFLLTRWTLNELYTMQSSQIISEDQFEELIQFPKSNLNLGFDQLNDNLKQVLDRLEIQSFLENTYTNISVYISTDTGEIYNLSLRNSIQILLSYQYDLKMRYAIEGSIVSDSPYVYFSYKNYIMLKNQFTSLNEFVLETTIQKSQQELEQIQTIFAITIAQLIIFKAISIHYFLVIKNKINKFFSLFKLLDSDCIMEEIQYLNYLLQQLKKDQNYLYQYKINIELKEQSLEQLIYSNSQKRLQIQVSYFKQFSLFYFLFFLILFSSCGNAILTYTSSLDYLQKYPFSVELFKKVSDIGTDVPTMYAQRQILYRVSYIAPFLNHYDIEQIFQELNNSLIRTQNFNLVQISLDNLLVSENFKQYFMMIQNQSLCDLLPEFLKIRSELICLSVMDQSLSRGLISTLEYICNFILTDMQISNFSNQTTFSYSELEGAFLVSNVIAEINSRFHLDFLDETAQFINQVTIHNVIILLVYFSIIIFIFIYVKEQLVQQYFLAQRIAYLIPIKAIIFNDSIERNLRQLLFEGLYLN